jgi:dTDP-glucose pyrophosphorylase
MAGNGIRFKKSGVKLPKYMIEIGNTTMFELSVASLSHLVRELDQVIFIVKAEDNAENFILKRVSSTFQTKNIEIIELNESTDGQASSVLFAKEKITSGNMIAIYNIDTGVKPGSLKLKIGNSISGHIPCFETDRGDHWSFVKVTDNYIVTEVAEKKRISRFATLGLYWFKGIELYEKAYMKCFENNQALVNGEKYIAPMYDWMIKNDYLVSIELINKDDISPLGTPSELNVYLENIHNK